MIAQPAGVVGRRDESAAQSIHLGQRTYHAGVTEIIGILAPSEAGAGCRFHGDDLVVRFAPELLAHERGDESAQIGAAAGTADDHVGFDTVFIQCRLGFQADDRLVQEHLVQNAAQYVSVTGCAGSHFHRFGDGAAQRTGGSRIFLQDLTSDSGSVRGRRRHFRAVGAHHFPAEGLLLVADFDHVDLAVQTQISTGHGQGGTPLAGAGLGSDTLQALFFGIIGLSDGGVELMASGGVVAFEFVVDLGGGPQCLFQAVGPYQRGGTVHLVEVLDLLGDVDVRIIVVQLLLYQFLAEHRTQFLGRHGLQRARIEQRSRFVLHVRTDVVPLFRDLVFTQIDFVRDFFCHGIRFLSLFAGKQKLLSPQIFVLLGQEY